MEFLMHKPTRKNLSFLFAVAFLLRAATFYFYIQHNERYHQPDSMDYHICAVLLGAKQSMSHAGTKEPIFWRTPGYPAYLAPFYWWRGIKSGEFNANAAAQKASIGFQIFLTSFIPIILFFLAFILTESLIISWITAWISVFHLGFILASTYLLTDALASLFFYLFLLLYYRVFFFWGQKKNVEANWLLPILGAALSLAAYTWMRPMGKFVVIGASMLLLFDNTSWRTRAKKIACLLLSFFTLLSPWYIRNYQLTGKLFFCPMSGGIMQAFVVPKLMRRATGWSYTDCLRQSFNHASRIKMLREEQLHEQAQRNHTQPYVISMHLLCNELGQPWIRHYPIYFIYDWLIQVIKTAFDLHAYQLVTLHNNTFMSDPAEEFLIEKLAACLYAGTLSWPMRLISWLELLFFVFVWIGLFAGLFHYILLPIYQFFRFKRSLPEASLLWLKVGPLIGTVLLMTGGFGYARLRIPVDPLMIILALTWWVKHISRKIMLNSNKFHNF